VKELSGRRSAFFHLPIHGQKLSSISYFGLIPNQVYLHDWFNERQHAVKTIHNARYQTLVRLLMETRVAEGLTQKELADRLGRPQSFVSKTENSERRLDVIEFIEICRGMGKDPKTMLASLE
jgi:hypothetical protein